MTQKIKSRLGGIVNVLEIILSVGLILAIIVFAIDIFKMIWDCIASYVRTGAYALDFRVILSAAIQLIIAIEFIKMLAKHSPASAVEVVLFVIAKSVILDDNTSLEMLLGVLSLAILFVVRKYLFTSGKSLDSGFLFKGDASVREVCSVCRINIPDYMGETLRDVVENEFMRLEKPMREHESVDLDEATIMIHKISDKGLDILEVWKKKA